MSDLEPACPVCRSAHPGPCGHWCHRADAEGWHPVGTAHLVGGYPVEVIKAPDETVVIHNPESGISFTFSDTGTDELRELLDRAATPGQVSARVYPCCGHCARERELTGAGPCEPPGHLTRCTNGCGDAAQAVSG